MKENYLLFIILLTFISCKNEKSDLTPNKYSTLTENKGIRKQTKVFHIDEQTLNAYQVSSSYMDDNNTEYIVSYNAITHNLDVININSDIISHIKLVKEGINGIFPDVSGLYVHNMDSIFLYSQNKIFQIDGTGELIQKITPPVPDGGFIMMCSNFSLGINSLYYNNLRKSIFYLTFSESNENQYFVYEYFLLKDEFIQREINGTELETNIRTDYGWRQMPNITYTDYNIIYNYPINSNIYTINIESGEQHSFGGQSKYTDNLAKKTTSPLTFESADRNLIESVHFFNILYNKSHDVYYRLHLGGDDYHVKESTHTQFSSKPIYLMLFDNEFNVINEIVLEKSKYDYFTSWGMLNSGLYLTERENIELNQDTVDIVKICVFSLFDKII